MPDLARLRYALIPTIILALALLALLLGIERYTSSDYEPIQNEYEGSGGNVVTVADPADAIDAQASFTG